MRVLRLDQSVNIGRGGMSGTIFRTEVDQITASDWTTSLGSFEDANIYQTWSYGAVRWGERNLSHLLLKRGDATVAIAQVLVVRPRNLRIGIAHLRWGPLCHLKGEQLDLESVQRIATALHDEYVRRRGLFLRVLPKAYLQSPRASVFKRLLRNSTASLSGPASHSERLTSI